jgi:glycosyltransferase involved in cell wall biosynthesis
MKKVLIITYYWPPAGGPGVQRIVKFTHELPQFGWQPLVLTVKDPSSPAKDESLLTKVPDECIVYKTPTIEPFKLYKVITGKNKNESLSKDTILKHPDESITEKLSRIIRANIFLPDARVGWRPSMIKNGLRIIEEEKPDIIFSTSPPHSLQLGAKKLAKKSGLKWVADFRDPWIEAYWEKDIERFGLSSRLNQKFEKSVLENADLITTVSDGLCDYLRAKVENRYETIYSGIDKTSAEHLKSNQFEIIYFGNMSQFQSPEPVFKAIDSFPADKKSLIKLIFVGNVYNGFDEMRKKFPEIQIDTRDYLPREKMMELGKSASLLLLINLSTVYGKGLITAKIFDYLALRKPILAIADKDGSLNELLDRTESGEVFTTDAVKSISIFIENYLNLWQEKSVIKLNDDKKLNPYRTGNNVKKLTQLFEKIL